MTDINLTDHDLDEDALKRVIRHSSDSYARACAWTLLDEVCDEPELEDLEIELRHVRERRGVSA